MAFTLRINSKGLFGKAKSIDFDALLKNCALKYGSANEFYIMKEGEKDGETAILYNPKRIGRGIYFDASKVGQGEITVSYNIPTTPTEIHDFVNVVKEIERQFGKAVLYCEEEEREYTTWALENHIGRMAEFSRIKLNEYCQNRELMQCILTLAMFPWYMDEEKREQYKECSTLIDFEKTVHELQVQDIYYAKPTLLRRNEDGQIAAVYTLTTGCESCFPVRPESFINLSGLKIDAAFIRFFIFEEKRAVDSFFPYSEFIEFIKEKGAVKFDAERIKVQPLSKEDVAEFIGKFEK